MSIDLFENLGRPDSELHRQFRDLRDAPGYAPARELIRELQQDFTDPDGNFVEQFQTFGFDSRTFEFFLNAMFQSTGHAVDRSVDRPDFLISKGGITAAVEAVTANPPPDGYIQPYSAFPTPKSVQAVMDDFEHTTPIRLGSPLFSKLGKEYWKLPHVQGHPLILAIEDFHSSGSLMSSSTSLMRYLFGVGQEWWHDRDGNLVIEGRGLDEHRVGSKKVPSGFFRQPNANNISAVLFCNTGTIAKFNRMGHNERFMAKSLRMVRWGTCYRHDPNATMPAPFAYEVGTKHTPLETWAQGTVLIRNPYALYPLPAGWLGAGIEQDLVGDEVVSRFAEAFQPFMSLTQIFGGASRKAVTAFANMQLSSLEGVFFE